MKRREFLLLHPPAPRRTVRVCCERLYMRCVDAECSGTPRRAVFDALRDELRDADVVEVVDVSWLWPEDLRRELDGMLHELGVEVTMSDE